MWAHQRLSTVEALLSHSKPSPIQQLTTRHVMLNPSVFLLCLIKCPLPSLHAAGEYVLLAISGTDVFSEDAVSVGSVWSQRSWASALPPPVDVTLLGSL